MIDDVAGKHPTIPEDMGRGNNACAMSIDAPPVAESVRGASLRRESHGKPLLSIAAVVANTLSVEVSTCPISPDIFTLHDRCDLEVMVPVKGTDAIPGLWTCAVNR